MGSSGPENKRPIFHVSSWRDYTELPKLDISKDQDLFLKISLEVSPKEDDHFTENCLKRFQENHVRGEKNPELLAKIPSKRAQMYYPMVSSDRVCRIYIYGSRRPFLMDLFLKTAWLLNILGAAGLVMAVFLAVKERTRMVVVKKTFKCFARIQPESDSDITANDIDSNDGRYPNDPLQDAIPLLQRHQFLQTPVNQLLGFESENCNHQNININEGQKDEPDLPPRYSVLDIEPPEYHEAVMN